MLIHLAIAAIIGTMIVGTAHSTVTPPPHWQRLPLIAISLYALLWLLTELERLGMYWIARRRGWRADRPLTLAICAHASCVWWVATTGMSIGVAVAGAFSRPRIDFGIEFIPSVPAALLFSVIGFMPGLLWFETLSFIGLRSCRYANLPQNLHKTVRVHRKNASDPSA